MKPLPLLLSLSVALIPLAPAFLHADEALQAFYAPVPSSLTGTLSQEGYGEDAAPIDVGRKAWILHLERPITVNAKEGDPTEVLERGVSEVQLIFSGDPSERFQDTVGKSSFTFYGTLSHATTTHHLRPIVMQTGGWQPVLPPVREIRPSPDGRFIVAWFDHDFGPPIGVTRSIVLRGATDPENFFSFVSTPRSTQAAWNAGSDRCVIADAPDNGGPRTWLVRRGGPDPEAWVARKIEPFAALEKAHYAADPGVKHLFRPGFSKIEWISATQVRFEGHCNSGRYLLTLDTDAPDAPVETRKLADEPFEK